MFTGIIEETGILKSKVFRNGICELKIFSQNICNELHKSDSVCVNGICLTIKDVKRDIFFVDVVKETLERTTVKYFRINEVLNLEMPTTLQTRLSGHLVYGHIDGLGKIIKITREKGNLIFTIKADKELLENAVVKGSIAIDGISLTIVDIKKDNFTISIIPYTYQNTNLKFKKVGSLVNIETDIIVKIVKNSVKRLEKLHRIC
jgi:riboflavin synthase